MKKRLFEVVVEKDEAGVFVASVPELPGCYAQTDFLDELKTNIKEATEVYVESFDKEERNPKIQFIGIEKILKEE